MKTAKEWGRVAVSLPGWRWMPGMLNIGQSLRVVAPKLATCTGMYRGRVSPPDSGTADGWCRAWVINYDPDIDDQMCDTAPDPDDPATAGCLLALLGVQAVDVVCPAANGGRWAVSVSGPHHIGIGSTLGRACIAAAVALGRWPGGAE